MLKDLSIQNLVLMESCKICFDEGLSVLTGETGSGKTAILQSLKLLLGQKLDTSLIRSGEQKGLIQASFEVSSSECLQILANASIPMEDQTLIITREVFIEGKSKNFVNDRMVSLSFLQEIGPYLIQIVDQSSHHELKQADKQRDLLDRFGSLQPELLDFQRSFSDLKKLKVKAQELEELERQKEREIDFCLSQQKELSSLSLEEGEEEKLFEQYSHSFRSQEVSEKIDRVFDFVQNGKQSILSSLTECKSLCQSMIPSHSSFEESYKLLDQASLMCKELLSVLRQTLSVFDVDPHTLELCEKKLSLIEKMKKKYGPSVSAWEEYKQNLAEKIIAFDNLEEDKKNLQEQITQVEKTLGKQATTLTEKRKQAALIFAKSLQKELNDLNMTHAKLEILIEKQPRSFFGEDGVCFCLSAGLGEALNAVKESASGGELSRLLLAIKLCLAEKNSTKTLIFDEIDANVGGETAKLIGQKLLSLSLHRQVICVTHFPQVASQATSHFCIQKQAKSDRTVSSAQKLDAQGREQELIRMLGGKSHPAIVPTF